MAKYQDIDRVLKNWPLVPGEIQARTIKAADGRGILQMRVELGLLQMEVDNRPDGQRPGDCDTYFDLLLQQEMQQGSELELTEEQCQEIDREFVQFYHRRICWLSLREMRHAVADAEHTLRLMNFCKKRAKDDDWVLSHEQYRPFVLFHRYQAGALALLEEDGPEAAIGEINGGMEVLRGVFREYDAEDKFEDDELVKRLLQLKEALREHYQVGRTLDERLADAIATEQYELAAKLRDEMSRRVRRR